MSKNLELQKRRENAVARGIGSAASDRFIESAANSRIIDSDGNEYIDFAAGIAVVNTGHVNQRINLKVKEQLDKFVHSAFQVMPYESYIELAEKINQIVPIDGRVKSIFFNSGAEAVENGIKIAKAYTKREAVISFVGGFHGRTAMTMALTGKVFPYKKDFGLPQPYNYHIPFPIEYHGISTKDSIKAIEYLFKATIAPNKVATIIVEPVMGEGGFYRTPNDLMNYLRKLCDDEGIVLFSDEVQTGFARTGRVFAMEYFDVSPDIISMAKGMAGGFVLSGLSGKADILDAPDPGGLGGTYAGSSISCVAALEVLNIIEQNNLTNRADELGKHIRKRLKKLESDYLVNIRGLGCMNAFELIDSNKLPDPSKAQLISQKCIENGLIIIPCGIYGNSIRILNPLTIEQMELDFGLDILGRVIHEIYN